MSHSREHSALSPDKVHTVHHARCLPQGSGQGKRIRLPTVGYVRAILASMEIGDKIRQARMAAAMSQTELATAVGVSRGLVGQWESHRKKPGRENLERIARVTASDIATFFGNRAPSQGVSISDESELAVVRLYRRMSSRQRQNLLDLLSESVNVRRQIERQRSPVKADPVGPNR